MLDRAQTDDSWGLLTREEAITLYGRRSAMLPKVTRDSLLDVEADHGRWGEDQTIKFMVEQPELCQFAFELIDKLGWTMDHFTAAMTICHLAFDALNHQMGDQPPAQQLKRVK